MIEIKFKKEHPDAVLPKKAHESDAGFDVVAVSKTMKYDTPGEDYIEYDLGFSTEIPEGYKGVIVPRSSISKYNLIMCNSPAQIDSSYRNTWKIRFKILQDINPTNWNNIKTYQVGERIAQIFFEPILNVDFKIVEELTETERNQGGFGSTGIK